MAELWSAGVGGRVGGVGGIEVQRWNGRQRLQSAADRLSGGREEI